jgi:FkbM family methyltransferase
MLSFRKFISRPEYVQRPRQALRRILRCGQQKPAFTKVTLPWGAEIFVHTGENIGSDIFHFGVFDKIVPETIWRLLDRGEVGVDVGANIGQNCSVMSVKVGAQGKVYGFEPHPQIFSELRKNSELWKNDDWGPIQLEQVALGELEGDSVLTTSEEFSHNRGSAVIASGPSARGFKVKMHCLDDYLAGIRKVGVCKLDVEGHEPSVIAGAAKALQRSAIRDLIYEDFTLQPSPMAHCLQQYGFQIFELRESWLKPKLSPVSGGSAPDGFTFNFLATLEGDRAQKRFKQLGWRCLLNY